MRCPPSREVPPSHRALAAGARDALRREPPAGIMAIHQLTASAATLWVPSEDLARHALGPPGVRQM